MSTPEGLSDVEVFDVVVIGAGLAGSSLAALLARRGLSVALIEQDSFPRDKLCGEFLSIETRRLLREVGCLDEIERAEPASIHSARFTAPSGRSVEIDLGGSGLGLSRRVLDETLFRHAQKCGAQVFDTTSVVDVRWLGDSTRGTRRVRVDVRRRSAHGGGERDSSIEASVAIGAFGRRSALDRRLERRFLSSRRVFVGMKRHHRACGSARQTLAGELDGRVEVYAFDGGYCGVSFVESETVNVCALLARRFVERLPSTSWDEVRNAISQANPRLARRFAGLQAAESGVHSVAGVFCGAKERASGPLLLVGDAAGMIPPFCGDGQAMAIESAILLDGLLGESVVGSGSASCSDSGLDDAAWRALCRRWDREWRRQFGRRMRLGRWIQPLLLRRLTAETAVLALRGAPAIARRLMRATRGPASGTTTDGFSADGFSADGISEELGTDESSRAGS